MNYYAPNLVCICVDNLDYPELGGNLYHHHSPSPVRFTGIIQLIAIMDSLFDALGIPQASAEPRSFTGRAGAEPRKYKNEVQSMSNRDIRDQRGDKGTFIVHVQYRQNATWQGSVVWAEKNITQNFRSALELLKLIDSAFDDGSGGIFSPAESGLDTENNDLK